MKEIPEIVLLGMAAAGTCGAAWFAWKISFQIAELARDFRSDIDRAVNRVLAELPAKMPMPPAAPMPEPCRFHVPDPVAHNWPTHPDTTRPIALVEIVKKAGSEWVHVGYRANGTADVAEALAHPELAIRHVDGSIEGGTC